MLSAAERADSAGLHYVEPDTLPLRRVKKGKGFAFVDGRSHTIKDAVLKHRLQKLAVPPAWEDVKLARDPKSHIQAIGRDEAGRLQYKYHERWTEAGHEVKRERLVHLGDKLGAVREEIEAQLRRQTVDEDFALSCALALLDRVWLRIGYPEYSREDGGRGATTLTRKDVAIKDGVVRLRFFGKGGKRIQRIVEDKALARALALLKSQPGDMLFRWKDKNGDDCCLSADGVNAALRERFSETTSAKDFRTFRASSIVAGALQDAGKDAKTPRLAVLRQAIRQASEFLANTPTVCKSSYVHPDVQDAFADDDFDATPLFSGQPRAGLTRGETALMRLVGQKSGK
jgi:DNA topoisomerase-1